MLVAKKEQEKTESLKVVKNDSVQKKEKFATDEEVLAISKKINEKYPELFKALANG